MSGYFQRMAEDNEAREEFRDGLEADNADLRARVEKLERVRAAAAILSRNWNYQAPWSTKTMDELDAALAECGEVANAR